MVGSDWVVDSGSVVDSYKDLVPGCVVVVRETDSETGRYLDFPFRIEKYAVRVRACIWQYEPNKQSSK